jgi:hypothetical protein
VTQKDFVFKTFKVNPFYPKIKGSGKDLKGYSTPFAIPSCALWFKKIPIKKTQL